MDVRTEQTYQQRIVKLELQNTSLEACVSDLTRQLAERNEQLTQRDATIAALQQQVAELSKQVTDLLAQVHGYPRTPQILPSHRPAILSNHRYRLFLRAKNVSSAGRKAIHVMNASLLLRIRLTG